MRVATAYFIGAGTVVVAIAAGLGGGLLLGNIMSPQQPKYPSSEVTRLEQRASQQPIQAMNGATQPVPNLPAPQATVAAPPSQTPQQAQPQPQQAQPQAQQASTQPAEPKQQAETTATAAPQPAAAPPPATTEQTATRERAAPDDAYAKARDADLKRDARRAEESKRKADRRQQWVERRKSKQRDGDELDDVEASVRQTTAQRSFFGREESRPVLGGDQGFGRIRIFDSND
jgi:outer membrane biosynthesis protein TonB